MVKQETNKGNIFQIIKKTREREREREVISSHVMNMMIFPAGTMTNAECHRGGGGGWLAGWLGIKAVSLNN